MKKLFCALLVLLMALVSVGAADSTGSTKRRGALEFEALFAQRYTASGTEDGELTINPGYVYSVKTAEEDEDTVLAVVSSSAGTLTIDLTNFTVYRAAIKLMENDATRDENQRLGFRACMAVSALEYSQAEDDIMRLTYSYLGGPRNASVAAIDDFRQITEAMTDQAISDAIGGERVKVYSGNYDYYLKYVDMSAAGLSGVMWLEADAR